MLVIVFINKPVIARVIRRVNINTFHLSAIACLQQIECLEIVGVDNGAVGEIVERMVV